MPLKTLGLEGVDLVVHIDWKGVDLVVVPHRLEGGGFGGGPISIGERNEDAGP